MNMEILSDALNLLEDRHIEAGFAPPERRNIRPLAAAVACLAILILAAVSLPPIVRSFTGSQTDSADGAGDACGTLPGDMLPELNVGGRLYYWDGISRLETGRAGTYLPDGYTEYGPFTAVPESQEPGESQLRAGFDAWGTVYTSEETPEAVYVLMTTGWFEDQYVRFTSDELTEPRIIWNGRAYNVPFITGKVYPATEELPEGCEQVGTLRFTGRDTVPQNDLETNCPSDFQGKTLDGRPVYRDPADPDRIYVYMKRAWREGWDDVYIICPLRQIQAVQNE